MDFPISHANPVATSRAAYTVAELDAIDRAARTLVCELTENIVGFLPSGRDRHWVYRLRREDGRSCPLVGVARLVGMLRRAKNPAASIERVQRFIGAVCEYPRAAAPVVSIDSIDRTECKLEADENRLALDRRIRGESPDALIAEATANEREASVQLERATWLRRRAFALECGGTARPMSRAGL